MFVRFLAVSLPSTVFDCLFVLSCDRLRCHPVDCCKTVAICDLFARLCVVPVCARRATVAYPGDFQRVLRGLRYLYVFDLHFPLSSLRRTCDSLRYLSRKLQPELLRDPLALPAYRVHCAALFCVSLLLRLIESHFICVITLELPHELICFLPVFFEFRPAPETKCWLPLPLA